MNKKYFIGNEWRCAAFVGANSFARNIPSVKIVRMNSHLQGGAQT